MESGPVLPVEIWHERILLDFSSPRDIAAVLGTCRTLRPERNIVSKWLRTFFKGAGSPGAVAWVLEHHRDEMHHVSLAGWLHSIKRKAQSGSRQSSVGPCSSLVLTPAGRPLAAGRGRFGTLGTGGKMNAFVFTEISLGYGAFPAKIPVVAVSCGAVHTLFLSCVGTVHSCGLGEYGRLGHGDRLSLARPRLIEALVGIKIVEVAAGGAHSAAVSWEGLAYTWGWGLDGRLGHGDEHDRLEPTLVDLSAVERRPDASAASAEDLSSPEKPRGSHRWRWGARSRAEPAAQVDPAGPHRHLEGHERAGLGGARDRAPPSATCVSAGESLTLLGTREGSVLVAGLCRRLVGRFLELWCLAPGAGPCRRVDSCDLCSLSPEKVAGTAVDSVGGVHVLRCTENANRSRAWPEASACKVPISIQVEEGACGGEKQGDESDGSGEGEGEGEGERNARYSEKELRCKSAKLSPLRAAADGSWPTTSHVPEDGGPLVFVGVAEDGSLLVSDRRDSRARFTVRSRVRQGFTCVEGHFSMFTSTPDPFNNHVLVRTAEGKSLFTWGSNRYGQLGNGASLFEASPKMVTTAHILGDNASDGDTIREAGVMVSVYPSRDGQDGGVDIQLAPGDELEISLPFLESLSGDMGLLAAVDTIAEDRDMREAAEKCG